MKNLHFRQVIVTSLGEELHGMFSHVLQEWI